MKKETGLQLSSDGGALVLLEEPEQGLDQDQWGCCLLTLFGPSVAENKM